MGEQSESPRQEVLEAQAQTTPEGGPLVAPSRQKRITRRLSELQRTVDRLELFVKIITGIAAFFGVTIMSGVLWLNATIARYEVEIATVSRQLEKLESRLGSFEKGEGPYGQQLKRLQDQVDAMQKERGTGKPAP